MLAIPGGDFAPRVGNVSGPAPQRNKCAVKLKNPFFRKPYRHGKGFKPRRGTSERRLLRSPDRTRRPRI